MPLSGVPERSAAAHSVPDDTVVYAVGDIHGCADLLDVMHGMIRHDSQIPEFARKVLIYLGDYVDRGPDSKGVVDRILEKPLEGFETYCLIGNHEDFLVDFLADPEAGPLWLSNGGLATLLSYGVDFRPDTGLGHGRLEELQQQFFDALPSSHLDFYRELQFSHVEGDYFFVHAGVRPGVPLHDQSDEDMLWIRNEFLDSSDDFGKMIVHGHTISWEPEFRGNRIGIDTGAFASGVLTGLALKGYERDILRAQILQPGIS